MIERTEKESGGRVTEPERLQARLSGQNRVLEMVATGAPLPEVLDQLRRLIEDEAADAVCSVNLLDPDDSNRSGGPISGAQGAWPTNIMSSRGEVLGFFEVKFCTPRQASSSETRVVEMAAYLAGLRSSARGRSGRTRRSTSDIAPSLKAIRTRCGSTTSGLSASWP